MLPGPDTEEAEPGPAAGAGRAQGEVRSCSIARIEYLKCSNALAIQNIAALLCCSAVGALQSFQMLMPHKM